MTPPTPLHYVLRTLPDRTRPSDVVRAGGDVAGATRAAGEHFLRVVPTFEPGAVAVAWRFLYQPEGEGGDPQQRLTVHLVAQAHREEARLPLAHLLAGGPLIRFHELVPADGARIPWQRFAAVRHVVRWQRLIEPTVRREFNARALPAYYTIAPFEPRRDNDYLTLVDVLGQIQECVLFEVCVEPAETAGLLAEHTRYLSRLQQVNRTWDAGEESDGLFDFEGEGFATGGRRPPQRRVELLREREPLADDVLRRQQRFHETLLKPHLRFHIRVFAESASVARLLASTVGECAFENGSYDLLHHERGDPLFQRVTREHSRVRVVPAQALQPLPTEQTEWPYEGLRELSNVAPVEELASVCRLPLASHGSPCCIRKNTDPPSSGKDDLIVLGHEEVGGAGSSPVAAGLPRGISVVSLTKHVFVSGMTGSGKTTKLLGLLLALWQRCIPVLVIEPAMREYRALKCLRDHPDEEFRRLAREIRLWTPGQEDISPLRLNPMRKPQGVSLNEWIETIAMCFRGGMPLAGPLPAILNEGQEEVYAECLNGDRPPRMADLYAACRRVLDRKGYAGEVESNLRAALDVRLGALTRRAMGQIFQCRESIPTIEELVGSFSVIELAALPPEQACLFTLFLLATIRAHVATTPYAGGGPRLVILLEEAHNLVGRNTDAAPSEENADPKAFASQFICVMLAELRALGVSIVIADQHPSAIAPEVVKSTGTKLAFRQVATEDRETLGGAMLFGPIEMEEIARLRPGEAYLFTEGYHGPRRIRTPNVRAEQGIPEPPVGDGILPFLRDDPWFVEATRARVTAELGGLRRQMDDFDRRRLATNAQAARMVARRVRLLSLPDSERRRELLSALSVDAQALRSGLAEEFRAFRWDAYRPLLGESAPAAPLEESLMTLRAHLVHRSGTVIEPDTTSCLEVLDRLVQDCSSDATP